jgi:nicotinamide-nucleotide amidase
MRSVSILATGSELLDGRVVDTNSNFVAKELAERGLKLKRVLVVDDDMSDLVQGLRELSTVSDFIITSGGLGPTSDDLTRDMVAAFSRSAGECWILRTESKRSSPSARAWCRT